MAVPEIDIGTINAAVGVEITVRPLRHRCKAMLAPDVDNSANSLKR
jgi:hypothetical protein